MLSSSGLKSFAVKRSRSMSPPGSVQCPKRNCREILDEQSLPRQHRLRPRGAVGDVVALDDVELFRVAARDDQLRTGAERKPQIAGAHHGGVVALARLRQPARLAGVGIDREILSAVAR